MSSTARINPRIRYHPRKHHRSAQRSAAAHSTSRLVDDPARHDVLKPPQIGGDVERNTVAGHTATNADSNGAQLA